MYWILDGQMPVPCADAYTWAQWLVESKHPYVVETMLLEDVRVSTVFLGLDHRIGTGLPLLFHSQVFGGALDGTIKYYSTWAEAEAGHAALVAHVQVSLGERRKEGQSHNE